jgi:hypothetical protein
MGDDVKPSERSIHPPRWAEALWRLFLGNQAEAEFGDLLEVYRDSIYPTRGRLRADFWFVWQLAGCLLRANSTMNLRNWVLGGLALCVLTLVISVVLYPDPIPDRDPHEVRNLIAICGGFLFYTYVGACRTRAKTPEDTQVLRLGTAWGLTIGALQILGLVSGNLVGAHGIALFSPILLALVAFSLSFIAGAHGAIKTRKVSCGLRVGFWSGLISGLMTFLALAAIGYILAFVPGLPGAEIPSFAEHLYTTLESQRVNIVDHVYTALEYQRLNVFDALGGGLAFLFGFGGIFSTVAGLVGGCAGILLERTGRIPDVSSRN